MLKPLANLKFAISLLFVIGIIIGIGTIIEQDQSLAFIKKIILLSARYSVFNLENY